MSLKTGSVLKFEDHHKQLVFKEYNVTREILDRDVDSLIEWYGKQQHLPQIKLGRSFVEGFLIRPKYSMEKAKKSLDLYFSYKHQAPEFYCNRIPSVILERAKGIGAMIPLAGLDSNAVRTTVMRLNKNIDYDKYEFIDIFKFMLLVGELRMETDFCLAERVVFDLEHFTPSLLLKMYPSVSKKAEYIIRNVFMCRVVGVHFLIGNSIIEKVATFCKSLMSEKLQKRVHFHSKAEELHEFMPREILPSEYGGDAGSYYDIVDKWSDLISSDEFEEWWKEREGLISDESKRIGHRFDNYLDDLPGSFRQLNVD